MRTIISPVDIILAFYDITQGYGPTFGIIALFITLLFVSLRTPERKMIGISSLVCFLITFVLYLIGVTSGVALIHQGFLAFFFFGFIVGMAL